MLKSVVASYHLAPRYDISRDTTNTDTHIGIYVMPSVMNAAACVAQEQTGSGARTPGKASMTAGIGFSFSVSCKDMFSNPIGKSAFYKFSSLQVYPDDLYHSNSIVASTSFAVPQSHSELRNSGMNAGTWSVTMQQQEQAGTYFVSVVTSGGNHIASSPFQMTVLPSDHCAARSLVSGSFMSLYAVNSFCTFSVIARDRFYNKLTAGERARWVAASIGFIYRDIVCSSQQCSRSCQRNSANIQRANVLLHDSHG